MVLFCKSQIKSFDWLKPDIYHVKSPTEDRLRVLDRAWELGCTNWDTASIYGDSEEVIGEWFKRHPERRADIFLATKFGFRKNDAGIIVDASPEHCLESAEQSLKRLNVTCIDLFYMHRTNGEVPIEKTVGAMKKLQEYVEPTCSVYYDIC